MPTKIIVTHQGNMKAKYGSRWPDIQAAVDRLIAADARKGLTTVLVPLDDPGFGQWKARKGKPLSFKQAVDHAYGIHGQPDYVAILGSPDIVPHQKLKPAVKDEDLEVPSDLPYACDTPAGDDTKKFVGPTRVVGRIPDQPHWKSHNGKSDPALLLTVLDAAAKWKAPAKLSKEFFGLSTFEWRSSTTTSLKKLFGASAASRTCPNDGPDWNKKILASSWHFINCHGGPASPQFLGQKAKDYPVAHDSEFLPKRIAKGTVAAAECCFGAELYDPALAPFPSICTTYLQEGAIAFLGSTTIAYGPAVGNSAADLICRYFMELVLTGASTGRALLEARQRYVKEVSPLSPIDLKTLGQFLLLGDPSLRCVPETPAPKSASASSKSLTRHLAMRGLLTETGSALSRGVDCAESTSTTASTDAQAVLAKAADSVDSSWKPVGKVQTFEIVPGTDTLTRKALAQPSTKFHMMTMTRPDEPKAKALVRSAGKKAAPANGPLVPQRLILLCREVAGKFEKIERLHAHLGPLNMGNIFKGLVRKKAVGRGSKSEHIAIVLDTGNEELVLRRFGGNAFQDPVLENLVGHNIKGTGERVGYTLILRDWKDLGKEGE